MTWSYSAYQLFKKCPRKWFFKSVFADSRANDPRRKEAHLLSKMQSIYAWRGQVVESAIQDFIIPSLEVNLQPNLQDAIKFAKETFDKQLAFGRNHRIRETGMTIKQAGRAFAAFTELEYGQPISDQDYQQAWEEVHTALRNFYKQIELKALLKVGAYRVTQRTLQFPHFGATVRAVPDLIVFFDDRSPLIVDWKVHTFGIHDYSDQLTIYAVALARVKPHADYGRYARGWSETDIELREAQLLRGFVRQHSLENSDIAEVDDRIATGVIALREASGGKRSYQLHSEDFPTAHDPQTCQTCQYRKICCNSDL
jgi:PD-(D/E)XK nuclease superfamily